MGKGKMDVYTNFGILSAERGAAGSRIGSFFG
jgi:hypothetical protein